MSLKKLKITVVGDGAVGKTCMIVSLFEGRFPEEYVPTM
jgi:GTPase SAR1 family protein